MENHDIARALTELADLLEIQGASPFRVRAYRNAAAAVESLARPVRDMVEAGEDLTAIPGIGESVATQIRALLATGTLPRLEEVTREIPRSLATLTQLEGVGPKKAKVLYESLGVATIDDLERALAAGKVEDLPGFGKRTAERIAHAIEVYRRHSGRFLIHEAEAVAEHVAAYLREAEGVGRVEIAGSLRRRKETIGDVDIVTEFDGDGTPVVEHFVRYPDAQDVEAAGSTKGTITMPSGLQVDLRVVPPHSFGAALQYFTGSKEHSVALRIRAVRMGLRLNEWGVFRTPEDEAMEEDPEESGWEPEAREAAWGPRVAGEREEGVYEALGLVWIPPVLRENRGEIEAAEEGRLPELVRLEDIRGDLQMHSTWSDGKASIEEMARACLERGYAYMAITDHSQAMAMVGGLTPERAREQWREVEEVQERLPDIRIFRSAEVDILKDGALDLPDDVLEELDLVVVSVHSYFDLDRDAMTRRILRAVRHPAVDILAHPTGRLLNRRDPFDFDVEEVLHACAEEGVAVELNANPHRLDFSDVHVHRARELGVPVVISTDAHKPSGLDNMRFGVDQARRGWLTAADVLNTRSLEDFQTWMAARGAERRRVFLREGGAA